jgi:phage terminase small subunit
VKLKPRQLKAIDALLRGKRVFQAAAAAGVSTMTLHRWRQDPDFQTAYAEGVRRVFGDGIDRLQVVTGKAVRTLEKGLRAPKTGDQLKAADRLLTHGLRAAEMRDLADRVEELEKILREKEGKR